MLCSGSCGCASCDYSRNLCMDGAAYHSWKGVTFFSLSTKQLSESEIVFAITSD